MSRTTATLSFPIRQKIRYGHLVFPDLLINARSVDDIDQAVSIRKALLWIDSTAIPSYNSCCSGIFPD
ncbi:MAG: hypothetical protein PHQ97_13030 [Desulfobacterales bacterium]|nr:hypothetical protein [Desulfobacterales bacterium]